MSINWRASLVPAAAVIPAPIVYIKVVAVEKLVVEFLRKLAGPPFGWASGLAGAYDWMVWLHLTVWHANQGFYFEEIRVSQAGPCLKYISME